MYTALSLLALVILATSYVLCRRYSFNKAIQKYLKATEEGKHPMLMVGAVWHTFYEHYDISQLSKEVRTTIVFAGAVAVAGKVVMYYTRRPPRRTI